MKVNIVEDPRLVRVCDGWKDENGVFHAGECWVLREDVENAKAFAAELRKEKDKKVIQEWEKSYFKQVKEQYSAQVAGAMLAKVWEWAPTYDDENPEQPESGRTWGTEELSTVAKRIMEKMKNGTQ